MGALRMGMPFLKTVERVSRDGKEKTARNGIDASAF